MVEEQEQLLDQIVDMQVQAGEPGAGRNIQLQVHMSLQHDGVDSAACGVWDEARASAATVRSSVVLYGCRVPLTG